MTSQFIALCIEAGIPVSTEAELAMMVTRGLGFILTIDDISGYPNIVVGRVSNITFESSDESSGAWLNLRTDVTTDLCRMQTRSCSISYSGQGPEEYQQPGWFLFDRIPNDANSGRMNKVQMQFVPVF